MKICLAGAAAFDLRLLAYVFLGATLVAAAPVQGGDIVVASNLPTGYSLSSFDEGVGFTGDTSNGFFSNETPAQEFTAAASGHLSTLITTVDQFQPEGVPLVVSFYTASGSIPGSLLGSATFAPSEVSTNAFVSPSTLDVTSANVDLVAGQSYFLVLSVATPILGSVRYRAILLNSNPNFFGFAPLDSKDGGATWFTSPVPNEIGLTLFAANAVPEPSASLLLLTGSPVLLSLFIRRALSSDRN